MAGRFLGKALATVSLSVALASVAVRSTGCPAYRYFPDALGWAKRTPGVYSRLAILFYDNIQFPNGTRTFDLPLEESSGRVRS